MTIAQAKKNTQQQAEVQAKDFQTTVYAKCILGGEHTVVIGLPSMVCPIRSIALTMRHRPGTSPLEIEVLGENSSVIELIIWGLIQKSCQLLGKSTYEMRGQLVLNNQITLGACLGGSAAMCAVVARWLSHLQWLPALQVHEFATLLEHTFHHRSSGVDVMGVMSETPVRYQHGHDVVTIQPAWSPKLYMSYCGEPSVTSVCVKQVLDYRMSQPDNCQVIDNNMTRAVDGIQAALTSSDVSSRFAQLSASMELANQCFIEWNLVSSAMHQHMHLLRDMGASAVKPTGAGYSGYCLSLWREEPPADLFKGGLSLDIAFE